MDEWRVPEKLYDEHIAHVHFAALGASPASEQFTCDLLLFLLRDAFIRATRSNIQREPLPTNLLEIAMRIRDTLVDFGFTSLPPRRLI